MSPRGKEAKHNKAMAEVMENAAANYKALTNMKEAEEKARTEAA